MRTHHDIYFFEKQCLIREAIIPSLVSDPTLQVTAYSRSEDMMNIVRDKPPDLIIMDVIGCIDQTLQIIQNLRGENPALKILILTDVEEPFLRLIGPGGADGYLIKRTSGVNLILESVRILLDGGLILSPHLCGRLIKEMHGMNQIKSQQLECFEQLTPREKEILRVMIQGGANLQIGNHLNISESTVKNHINRILNKLQVQDRTTAVIMAIKNYWFDGGISPFKGINKDHTLRVS
jgi:DNA-binding NarL/FixJ family response regulator